MPVARKVKADVVKAPKKERPAPESDPLETALAYVARGASDDELLAVSGTFQRAVSEFRRIQGNRQRRNERGVQ